MELPRKINQNRIKGDIFLHSMPGKNEKLEEIMDQLKKLKVEQIFCLSDKTEIEKKSPEYLQAVQSGHYDDLYITYSPNRDCGFPESEKDLMNYKKTLAEAMTRLKSGNIMIHCKGGVGRTGTFAVILLRMIGYTYEEALQKTKEAGALPSFPEQQSFCKNYPI
jgi:protein-tyrosine phosphatase